MRSKLIQNNLIPIKRTVHKKGKTFTQTFYVNPAKNFSIGNLINLLEISKDEVRKFERWFGQIKKDKTNKNLLRDIFRAYSQGAVSSLNIIKNAYIFNTSLLHEHAHYYLSFQLLSTLKYSTIEIRDKFGIDIVSMLLDENDKLNVNNFEKDKTIYWQHFFEDLLSVYKYQMREDNFSLQEQDSLIRKCVETVIHSFYPKTSLNKADLGSFLQKFNEELKKRIPLDKNKIELPDIGTVSITDIFSFFHWISSFTNCAWMRLFYKDYEKGELPWLPEIERRLLKFFQPIQDPILFRGTRNYDKWKQARIGMSIPIGIASFSRNFGDALYFTEEHYQEWEYGYYFKKNPDILPVLVIKNVDNRLTGLDLKRIETSFKKIENEFEDILENNEELRSLKYLEDIGYENEVILQVPKGKIIDIVNAENLFIKYPDIAKKYIKRDPSTLDKVQFFILEPDYD